MKALSLAVVGADHPNKRGPARRWAIGMCAPGEPVQLVPEPKNPKDPHAVMVMSEQGVQMGYLTAERAPLVGGWLRDGREIEAVFQEKTSFGAWIRVALDGAPIEVPPAREAAQQRTGGGADDTGFYPDWIPPDE